MKLNILITVPDEVYETAERKVDKETDGKLGINDWVTEKLKEIFDTDNIDLDVIKNPGSMNIRIMPENVYGVEKIYVVSEPHKKAISYLTGHRTINLNEMLHLKSLGFRFYNQGNPIKDQRINELLTPYDVIEGC